MKATQIHPKVAAGVVGTSFTTVIIWVIDVTRHTTVPTPVALAIATVVSGVLGYLTPGLDTSNMETNPTNQVF